MKHHDDPLPRKYLSPENVSDELGIPLKTIHLWIPQRQFPYARLGKHFRILPCRLPSAIPSRRQRSQTGWDVSVQLAPSPRRYRR